ncbi:MAG: hypothetical protein ACOC34_02895 [Thermotogota bacterium]
MEADEKILNELEQLRQLFSDMKEHVSDIRGKIKSEIDEKTEAFEQLNGRSAALLDQITKYADTLQDVLGYKSQVEEMITKLHRIDEYEQKRDGLESSFQGLTEKINRSIEEIENKLLAFDVSCEEDLITMNESLTATKETKTKAAEQIRDLEEQRKTLEVNLKKTADNAGELENRLHKLEESYNIERIEKIDAFMTEKSEIENFLISNTQEIDRQKSQAQNVQETIQHSEDNLQQIKDQSENMNAFIADTREEYENIREMIDKAMEEFDEYFHSQRGRTQKMTEDFNQTIQSFKEEYQKQINALTSDEMDRIKATIKVSEKGMIEKVDQTTETLHEFLEGGKQTLSKQTDSGIQEMEGLIEQTKSDIAYKLTEIEEAHQKQLKVQKSISDDKNTLDKNLKINKWMMIINVMVMVLTMTVLFLSLFFN